MVGIRRTVFNFCGFANLSSSRLKRSVWDPLGFPSGDLWAPIWTREPFYLAQRAGVPSGEARSIILRGLELRVSLEAEKSVHQCLCDNILGAHLLYVKVLGLICFMQGFWGLFPNILKGC